MAAMIRASYTKLALKYLKQGHPENWDALRGYIGDAQLDRIRAAGPIAWLPAETHADVADATIALYGVREARAVWRDVMLAAFERSMLRPLVGGALRLYGDKPSSIMRMTPQGWSLAFKDCGRAFMAEETPSSAVMCFEALPSVVSKSPGVIESFVANCDAAMSYVHCRGQVTADRTHLPRGSLRIAVSWQYADKHAIDADAPTEPMPTATDDEDYIDMR